MLAAAAASAQDSAANFPDHPIRVVVSVPAGGGVDSVTRIVTAKMSAVLGQPLVVENKAGAGGSVAAEAVFKDAPDGYTLLASQPAPITTNPFLYKSLNYDPAQLTAIAIMSHVPNVILVREGLPVKTVQELIAYAKANPGKLNYASQGIGTTSHLTAELFQTLTQTKLVHVPYKGTAPALTDLLAGNVDLMFNELATSLVQHKAGKARILAVLTKERIAAIPDVPTIAEAGVAGCESDTWHALDRAAEDAGRRRRQAQRRRQQGDEGPGTSGTIQSAQYQSGRRHARRDGRLPQGRDQALGRCDPHRRHPAAIVICVSRCRSPAAPV